MTTKEQERKALEKIRKIVEELGQDSYIGVAFEGVLEDAEQNIEWDAAFSMKARLESADKQYKEVFDKVQEQNKRIEALEAENKELEDRNERLGQICADSANSSLKNWNAFREEQDKLEAAENEIIKLKAKLYDLMTA